MLRTLIPAIQHVFRSIDTTKSVQPNMKKSTATVAPSNPPPPPPQNKKPEQK